MTDNKFELLMQKVRVDKQAKTAANQEWRETRFVEYFFECAREDEALRIEKNTRRGRKKEV